MVLVPLTDEETETERLRNRAVIKEPGRGRVGPIQAEIRASDSPRLPAGSV